MEPFIKVQCKHCGPFMIADPDNITVFFCDVIGEGTSYMMAVYCNYCHQGIVEDIPESLAHKLRLRDVNFFSWFTGELEENMKV
jgi:hypothetical protein